MTKGYVVRGTWGIGRVGVTVRDVYAYWWTLIEDVQWCSERDEVPKDGRLLFPTIGEADAALRKSSHLSDVRIFAVAEDGTETPLLSYEEALARVDVLQKRERRMFDGFRAEIDRIQEALGIGPTRSVLWCVAEIGRLRSEAAVSHLAALRAAEERLLDTHGWKPGDPGFWIDPTDGTQWPREGAIAAVRRRPEPGAKDGNKQ